MCVCVSLPHHTFPTDIYIENCFFSPVSLNMAEYLAGSMYKFSLFARHDSSFLARHSIIIPLSAHRSVKSLAKCISWQENWRWVAVAIVPLPTSARLFLLLSLLICCCFVVLVTVVVLVITTVLDFDDCRWPHCCCGCCSGRNLEKRSQYSCSIFSSSINNWCCCVHSHLTLFESALLPFLFIAKRLIIRSTYRSLAKQLQSNAKLFG